MTHSKNNTAVLIIDMQEGVFDGVMIPPVSNASNLLFNVSQLLKKARSAEITVFFIQHNGEEGHLLEQGTDGWHLLPELKITDQNLIVQKNTPDSFYETNLQEKLIAVKRLVIAGIQTEYCIDTTCRRAFSLGYDVTLAKDAHGTWDSDQLKANQIIDHHNSLLGEWFASLKNVHEINFV